VSKNQNMAFSIEKRINTELLNDRKQGFIYKICLVRFSGKIEERKIDWREKLKCGNENKMTACLERLILKKK